MAMRKTKKKNLHSNHIYLSAVGGAADDDGLVLQVALQTGLSKVAAHARVLKASKRSVALRKRQSERD